MTVAELIERLKTIDPTKQVKVATLPYSDGFPIAATTVSETLAHPSLAE